MKWYKLNKAIAQVLQRRKTVLSSGIVQTEQSYRTGDTEKKKLYLAVELYKLNKAIAQVIQRKKTVLSSEMVQTEQSYRTGDTETKKLYLAVELYKLNKAIAQVKHCKLKTKGQTGMFAANRKNIITSW